MLNPSDKYIRLCRIAIFSIASIQLLLISIPSYGASELRVWLMPNEPMTSAERGPDFIDGFIENAALEGVIIENGKKVMSRSGLPEWQDAFGDQIAHQKIIVDLLTKFIQSDPEVDRVKVEFIRWIDAYYRYSATDDAVSSEMMPDLIQVGSTWISTFADKGILRRIEQPGDDDSQFLPISLSTCSILGQDGYYALPWFVDARAMYYWKKYFTDTDFSTLKTFRTALMNTRMDYPFVFNMAGTWNLIHQLAPWVWSYGGKFVTDSWLPDFYKAPWDSKPFEEAVLYLHDLAADNLLLLSGESFAEMDMDFISGRHAVTISSSGLIKLVREHGVDGEIGLALPPAGEGGSHAFVGGSNLAVTNASEKRGNAVAAMRLLGYLTDSTNGMVYANATSSLPATKEGLDAYLREYPDMVVFHDALRTGRVYPGVPVWGSVFENDIARTHLANLWNDIAYASSSNEVIATLKDISNYLNSRLRLIALKKYIYYISFVSVVALVLFLSMFVAYRRKSAEYVALLAELRSKLRTSHGQRKFLEGRILILERGSTESADALGGARVELQELNSRICELKEKLQRVEKREGLCKELPGEMMIESGGTISLGKNDVKFDNSKQAKALVDHVVRSLSEDVDTFNCLWGFVLFGWNPVELKSEPNRLFHIALSKVNTGLKKAGFPPLMKSAGKGSWLWSVIWDDAMFGEVSSIHRALRELEAAKALLDDGHTERGLEGVFSSLSSDPLCIEAYMVLQEYLETFGKKEDVRKRVNALWETGRKSIYERRDMLAQGIKSARAYLALESTKLSPELLSALEEELTRIDARHAHFDSLALELFGAMEVKKPAYMNEILRRLNAVYAEIEDFKLKGLSNDLLWANIVGGKNFSTLIRMPQIHSIINGYRDPKSREPEDARLVQLAMIWMLDGRGVLDELGSEDTPEKFFRRIRSGLSKKLDLLSSSIPYVQ